MFQGYDNKDVTEFEEGQRNSRVSWGNIHHYISAAIEWREILNGKSVEDQWQAFSRLLLDACDKFISHQKRRAINWPHGFVAQWKKR